jgi:hypothetical protein
MFSPVCVALPDLTRVVSVSSSAYGVRDHTLRVPWLRRGGAGPLCRRRRHEDPLGEHRRPQRPTSAPPLLPPDRETPSRSGAELASLVPTCRRDRQGLPQQLHQRQKGIVVAEGMDWVCEFLTVQLCRRVNKSCFLVGSA